jgi:hypothetical protein
MMRVVRRERQWTTKKIQKMVKSKIPEVWQEGVDDEGGEEGDPRDERKTEKMMKNQIPKVWQKGVDDEGGKAEARNDKEDRKMVKNQIPKVWQEGVDNEGGEKWEAGDDEEDREDGDWWRTRYLKSGKRE